MKFRAITEKELFWAQSTSPAAGNIRRTALLLIEQLEEAFDNEQVNGATTSGLKR